MTTNLKFWRYHVLSPLKTIDDVHEWDCSDTTNITSFNLDDDTIFGEGSGLYTHANTSNAGNLDLVYSIGLDISSYTNLFCMMKMDTVAATSLVLLSTTGNSNTYTVSGSCTAEKWSKINETIASPDSSAGTFDDTNLTLVRLTSSIANHAFYTNFIAVAREVFEFESDISRILQGLGSGLSISNSTVPILGRAGGISINEGSDDQTFNIPCFFSGGTALQNLIKLKNVAKAGYPVLFELENYGFYPIMIDGIDEDLVFREQTESTAKTQINLSIKAHMYNND